MFQQWMIARNKRKLFTFRTPWGLYRYLRLPSGVNCAGQECNNNLRAIVEGLEGIIQIADDIVVFGKGKIHEAQWLPARHPTERWSDSWHKRRGVRHRLQGKLTTTRLKMASGFPKLKAKAAATPIYCNGFPFAVNG